MKRELFLTQQKISIKIIANIIFDGKTLKPLPLPPSHPLFYIVS